MIGRDGSNRSATTEHREAAEPARLLGQAADAYTHAVVAGAETLIGPAELARIDAGAEQAVPGVTTAPAWETLRGHLAVLAADGRDPITALTAAAADRELDTARDLAAVLDYRLDPTGNHSQQPGPLPWLPAVPARLADHADWAPYLTARADHVRNLAAQVRAEAAAWTPGTAPGWAAPYLHNPGLVGDLAVWRAAESVDPDRPATGRAAAAADRHDHPAHRSWPSGACRRPVTPPTAPTGGPPSSPGSASPTSSGDDYWPVLAGRLTLADTAGLPVPGAAHRRRRAGPVADREPGGRAVVAPRPAPRRRHHHRHRHRRAAAHRVRPAWTDPPREHPRRRRSPRRSPPTGSGRSSSPGSTPRPPPGSTPPGWSRTPPGCSPATWTPCGRTSTPPCCCCTSAPSPTPNQSTPTSHGVDLEVPPDPADQDLLPPPDLYEHQPRSTARHRRSSTTAVSATRLDEVARSDRRTGRRHRRPRRPAGAGHRRTRPELDTAALDRAREAVAAAWDYYRQQAARSWVPGYLTGRGLDPALAGYAPAGWTRLVDHLRTAGIHRHRTARRRPGPHRQPRQHADRPVQQPGHAAHPRHRRHASSPSSAANTPPTPTRRTEVRQQPHHRPVPQNRPALRPHHRHRRETPRRSGPRHRRRTDGRPRRHHGRRGRRRDLRLVAVAPLGTALTAEQLATIDDIAPAHRPPGHRRAGQRPRRDQGRPQRLRPARRRRRHQPRHHHPARRAGPRPGPRRPRPRRARRRPHPPPAPGRPRRRRHHRLLARTASRPAAGASRKGSTPCRKPPRSSPDFRSTNATASPPASPTPPATTSSPSSTTSRPRCSASAWSTRTHSACRPRRGSEQFRTIRERSTPIPHQRCEIGSDPSARTSPTSEPKSRTRGRSPRSSLLDRSTIQSPTSGGSRAVCRG